jgi:hypothetical protein
VVVKERDAVAHYQIGGTIHPIQARKAWEDEESWREAVVVDQNGDIVEVAFIDDDETSPAAGSSQHVWISDRRHILAVADDAGNAIAVHPPDEMPEGSVFARAGAQRLRFIPARGTEPVDFLYGNVVGIDGEPYFYIVPYDDAFEVAEIVDIVTSCTTWGEVRRKASPFRLREILAEAGYGDLYEFAEEGDRSEDDLPSDDDPFSKDLLGSYMTLHYPPTFEAIQGWSLPADILTTYGVDGSVPGFSHAVIHPERGPDAVAELEAQGFRCVENAAFLQSSMDRFGF